MNEPVRALSFDEWRGAWRCAKCGLLFSQRRKMHQTASYALCDGELVPYDAVLRSRQPDGPQKLK
jgi:hypothetical protein